MRVSVDATCWTNRRGYGRHARALLSALIQVDPNSRYTFFVDRVDALAQLPSGIESRLVPASRPASAASSRRPADLLAFGQALSAWPADVILFPSVYSFVPVFSRARKAVFFHDAIAETYPLLSLGHPFAELLWSLKTRLALLQADAILTVSDYARSTLAACFELDRRRIQVVGEAPDPVFSRLHPAPPRHDSTIVYAGGFSPHKNVPALIDAFARIAARPGHCSARLILVGDNRTDTFHTETHRIGDLIRRRGLQQIVTFTGYIDDQSLVALLNSAAVLALPSLMEGFGLPAAEAAACGCPIVATTESPLPRLFPQGGLFVNPRNPAELEAALLAVLESSDLRHRMGRCAEEEARRLSWTRCATDLSAVLANLCASP